MKTCFETRRTQRSAEITEGTDTQPFEPLRPLRFSASSAPEKEVTYIHMKTRLGTQRARRHAKNAEKIGCSFLATSERKLCALCVCSANSAFQKDFTHAIGQIRYAMGNSHRS